MLSVTHFVPSLGRYFFTPAKGTAASPQKSPSPQDVIESLLKLKPGEEDAFFQRSLPQFIKSLDIKTLNATIRAKIASFTSAAEHAAKDTTFVSRNLASQPMKEKFVESSLLFRFFLI